MWWLKLGRGWEGSWVGMMVGTGKKLRGEHWELGGWEDVMFGTGKRVEKEHWELGGCGRG